MPPKVMGEDTTHESDAVEALKNEIEQAVIGVQVTATQTTKQARAVQREIRDVTLTMHEREAVPGLESGQAWSVLALGAKGDYKAILQEAGEEFPDETGSIPISLKNREKALALLKHDEKPIRDKARQTLISRIAQRRAMYDKNEHFKSLTDAYVQRLNSDMGMADGELQQLIDATVAKQTKEKSKNEVSALREQLQQQLHELLGIDENAPDRINHFRMTAVLQHLVEGITTDTKDASAENASQAHVDILREYVNITKSQDAVKQYLENALTTREGTEDIGLLRNAVNIYAAIHYARGDATPLSQKLEEDLQAENPRKMRDMESHFTDYQMTLNRLSFELAFKIFEKSPQQIDTAEEAKEYIRITLKRLLPNLGRAENALLEQAMAQADIGSNLLIHKYANMVRGEVESGIPHDKKRKIMQTLDSTTAYMLSTLESGPIERCNEVILTELKEFLNTELKQITQQLERLNIELTEMRRDSVLFEAISKLTDAEKAVYAAVAENETPAAYAAGFYSSSSFACPKSS